MPKSRHTFAHDINDDVRIIGLDGWAGRIDQMVIDKTGKQYRVRYWHEGERCQAWVDDDEISPMQG